MQFQKRVELKPYWYNKSRSHKYNWSRYVCYSNTHNKRHYCRIIKKFFLRKATTSWIHGVKDQGSPLLLCSIHHFYRYSHHFFFTELYTSLISTKKLLTAKFFFPSFLSSSSLNLNGKKKIWTVSMKTLLESIYHDIHLVLCVPVYALVCRVFWYRWRQVAWDSHGPPVIVFSGLPESNELESFALNLIYVTWPWIQVQCSPHHLLLKLRFLSNLFADTACRIQWALLIRSYCHTLRNHQVVEEANR